MLSRPSGPRCSGPTRRPCPCIPTWWVPAFIMPNGSCPALPIMTLMSLRCKAMIPSPVTSPFRGSSRSWKNRSLPIPGRRLLFCPAARGVLLLFPVLGGQHRTQSPSGAAAAGPPGRGACPRREREMGELPGGRGVLPGADYPPLRGIRRLLGECGALPEFPAGDPSRAGRRRLPL